MILILFAVFEVVACTSAQTNFAVSEGEKHTYQVEKQPGNLYSWVIYNSSELNTVVTSDEAQIISGENSSALTVKWLKQGTYYPVVTETDLLGCTNLKAIAVVVGKIDIPAPVVRISNPTVLIDNFPYVAIGSCEPVTLDASKSTGAGLAFTWYPSDFLDDPSSSTPVFTPGMSTKYYLTVTDRLGRSSTDSISVMVNRGVHADAGDDISIRFNESGMLDGSNSVGGDLRYDWKTETGHIVSGNTTANPVIDQAGIYYLTVTDEYGCINVDSVRVSLWTQAENDFARLDVNTFVDINVLRNDIPKGNLNPQSLAIVSPPNHGFATITSDSVITYTPDQFYVGQDNFKYTVCDYSERCDEATVLIRISDEMLFVPNAISPNGDGINDYFEILGIAQYNRVTLKVFNRWGNLVYESKNYGPGDGRDGFWNGIANKGVRTGSGHVPTGTYYYLLDLGDGNEKISGYIYLDR